MSAQCQHSVSSVKKKISFTLRGIIKTSPVVKEDFGEKAGQDAEVADGEDVDVDHVAQTVDNYNENRPKE